MTEIEKKANALVNDVRVERILYPISENFSLVQRLRRTYRKEYAPTRSMCGDNSNKPFPFPILATEVPVNPDGHEAADRIEALTAENERLREALFESVALNENYYAVEEDDGYRFTEAPATIAQARAALEKQP